MRALRGGMLNRRAFLAASVPLQPCAQPLDLLYRLCSAIAAIEAVPNTKHNPGGLMLNDRLLTFRSDAEGTAMLYRATSRHIAHGQTLRQFAQTWAPPVHEEYLERLMRRTAINPDIRLWDYLRIEKESN